MFKRLVSIQDISCFGKCSTTAIMPVISSCKIECDILPTALLSTHTAFKGNTFLDLTDEMSKIINHWKSISLHFDGIYCGYLGSVKQIQLLIDFIQYFKKENTTVLIDPVFADHGKLYKGFNEDYISNMKELIQYANVIDPNITEACFLTDTPYKEQFNEIEIQELCRKLYALGPQNVIITGYEKENQIGAYCYDGTQFYSYLTDKLPFSSFATGDIFSAVTIASILQQKTLSQAIQIACDFVSKCMEATANDRGWHFYSVEFEQCLSYLHQQFN